MRAFICDFQTTNEILFKERNNSLIELRFGVQELLKVINKTSIIDYEAKGVTTRGGKTTTQDAENNDTNVRTEQPLAENHNEPVESNEILTNDQPQKTNKPDAQPSNKIQMPPIPFTRRLRKEKEEAQQKKLKGGVVMLDMGVRGRGVGYGWDDGGWWGGVVVEWWMDRWWEDGDGWGDCMGYGMGGCGVGDRWDE
ncbi:hypothetical protein Tco_0003514 [Tanacetum coccineum]